jgi:hypothetical protein
MIPLLSRIARWLCRKIDHHWRIWYSVHAQGEVRIILLCDLCGELRELTRELSP